MKPTLTLLTALLLAPLAMLNAADARAGYPKPVAFRGDTPAMLEADGDRLQMVVSDHHVWTRGYGHEAFARRYPDKPVLVHAGGDFMSANAYSPKQMIQDRGLYDGDIKRRYIEYRKGHEEVLAEDFLPMPGFLGYWVYEAGVRSARAIEAAQIVKVAVPDARRFEPRFITPPPSRGELKRLTGDDRVPRIVVICPRDDRAGLSWAMAELADVIRTDEGAGTITVRRFDTGKGFPPLPAGCHVAATAPVWDRIGIWGRRNLPAAHPFHYPVWQFLMPNFTPHCPVDPETGLNAAQWFARHFIQRKMKYYPHSGGYALDVTSGTFFPDARHVAFADFNNDGVADRGFIDGVSWWGLGMHDFVHALREGVPGVFSGMGRGLLLTWDATDNGDQRFFHLLNGAEFEHTMIHGLGWGPSGHLFSSNLDRLLLWGERALSPNITFVSNKFPDEAYHGGMADALREAQASRPSQSLRQMRLDLASACMATGYFNKYAGRGSPAGLNDYPGKREETAKFGAALLQGYDEYHQGGDGIRNWLGQPLSPPTLVRRHLGPSGYSFSEASSLPEIVSSDPAWGAAAPRRIAGPGFRLDVERIGPYTSVDQRFTLIARLSLGGMHLEPMAEYAVSFTARGDSPYMTIAPRYRPIPRNLGLRFRAGESIVPSFAPRYYGKRGYDQECLVFEEERTVHLTLQAPGAGKGALEFCISEAPGAIEISNLEIRKGSADVLWRAFENGVVLLNGSARSAVEFPVESLFPGQRYRRLQGKQDPAHNSGQSVGPSVTLGPLDGLFLAREHGGT
ncbi:MAG: hypothetical protein IT577_11655 [Verrucomicrobiae bacterium]|nr:hypothetical protein [Verrucomicrobiae bacterium]